MHYSRTSIESIRRILASIKASSVLVEKTLKLSGAQLLVLQHLKDEEARSVNELARLTHTHQSSVSTVVSRLEKVGHVRRQVSQKDARQHELSITAKGLKVLNKAPVLAQERLIQAIEELSPENGQMLAKLLTDVVRRAGMSKTPADLFFEKARNGK